MTTFETLPTWEEIGRELKRMEEKTFFEEAQSGREVCLDTAKQFVMKDRNTSYGEPEQDFEVIADLWNAYLHHAGVLGDRAIEPYEVGILMGLLKVGRMTASPSKADHWFDLAGYTACGFELAVVKGQGQLVEEHNHNQK